LYMPLQLGEWGLFWKSKNTGCFLETSIFTVYIAVKAGFPASVGLKQLFVSPEVFIGRPLPTEVLYTVSKTGITCSVLAK
jgi:hypothetical protein